MQLLSILETPPHKTQQAFLLHEDVDKPNTWLAQIETSRDAYTALRTHFLKYIERPDDLSSAVDPLAEDEEVRTASLC